MNNTYYEAEAQKFEELTHRSLVSIGTFYQNLLIVSASVLGLLSALVDVAKSPLPVRVVFVAFVVSLSLSVLLCGIVAYIYAHHQERICTNFQAHFLKALQENKERGIFLTSIPPITFLLQKLLYTCLIIALLALVVYTILLAFL